MTTAFIPARLIDVSHYTSSLIAAERFLFFMAITIPFDVRDMTIDKQINVKTIVHQLGKLRSIYLAVFCLCCSISIVFFLFTQNFVSKNHAMAFGINHLLTAFLLVYCSNKKSDYYFTGLLDGTMIILAIIVWLFNS